MIVDTPTRASKANMLLSCVQTRESSISMSYSQGMDTLTMRPNIKSIVIPYSNN